MHEHQKTGCHKYTSILTAIVLSQEKNFYSSIKISIKMVPIGESSW